MESAYSDTNAGLHYDMRLEINPPARFVAVSGSLAYHSPQARLERARFYLHHQFEIQRISGRRVLGYHFQPDQRPEVDLLAQAGVLDIYFAPPLGRGETTLIQFEYQGTITDLPAATSSITPDWAELGMALPWYPLQYAGQPSTLTFTLKVTAPVGFQTASYGQGFFQDGHWYYSWPHPTSDMVVAVGRTLETQEFAGEPNLALVNTTTFSKLGAERLGQDLLWTMERFSGWFGPTRPAEFTLIESPRGPGGGYARRGLAVLAGVSEPAYLNQREAYFLYLAHQAAHAWWWEAPTTTWESWLNESFAEFSALLAVRERFGDEAFARFLDHKRERSQALPPLWGFERPAELTPTQQAFAERMVLDRGPLLLSQLCERVGYNRFLEFCRAMLWSGVTETAHLVELLKEIEDPATGDWFTGLLQSETTVNR